jgi:hypothetical protein
MGWHILGVFRKISSSILDISQRPQFILFFPELIFIVLVAFDYQAVRLASFMVVDICLSARRVTLVAPLEDTGHRVDG